MTARAWLDQLLTDRIAILDGAMGTMIQRHRLEERDFRGDRFAGHAIDLQGQQRRAGADAARHHPRHPPPVSRRRRRHHRDEHVQRERGLAVRLRDSKALVYDLNLEGARVARDRRRTRSCARSRIRAGSSPDRSGRRTARSRSRPTSAIRRFGTSRSMQMREAYVDQIRGLVDGGVDLILIETIIDALNTKAAIVAFQEVLEARRPSTFRSSSRSRSPIAAGARSRVRRSTRSISRWNMRSRGPSASTARSARRKCGRSSRSSRESPSAGSARIRTPACRTHSANTISSRRKPARCSAISRQAASSTSSAGAAARRPITSRRSASAVEGVAPRPRPVPASRRTGTTCRCACPVWSRSSSARTATSR